MPVECTSIIKTLLIQLNIYNDEENSDCPEHTRHIQFALKCKQTFDANRSCKQRIFSVYECPWGKLNCWSALLIAAE